MTERTDDAQPNNALVVEQSLDETGAQAMARRLLEPDMRHALGASVYASKSLGSAVEAPGIMDYVDHMQSVTAAAEGGDLALASRLLAAQAITLDCVFTEMIRQSATSMAKYPLASERYARIAFKAQSNCRATLEALAKLHQPREQTVRHVHVNDGGQAVIADQFHNHARDAQNGKTVKQSHATAKIGECSTLPCPDTQEDALPIPGCEREKALPDARRN